MNQCPNCGSHDTTETVETYTFEYGFPLSVPLTVTHPVGRCNTCELSWSDVRGENARTETIERYQRVFTQHAVSPRFVDLAGELARYFNSDPPATLSRTSDLYVLLTECLPDHHLATKK